ncbi:hypothetical protein EGR_09101 [Echinococcus granulosus]|uniref:Uncharacterized protein n=1 Tax=Echinococcus granulosus TaxID=6210 RepID=W6U6P6_ECHGR|nr:hypothetical protein EGR_09101 [Echinococcus granulosus]EUB56021.1 hypothetical protein EGR_09101 [Echinococcus granulosus]
MNARKGCIVMLAVKMGSAIWMRHRNQQRTPLLPVKLHLLCRTLQSRRSLLPNLLNQDEGVVVVSSDAGWMPSSIPGGEFLVMDSMTPMATVLLSTELCVPMKE